MHKAKTVTKCKLMCPLAKTKQIETLQFGAEKDLLQGQSERGRCSCLRNPKQPKGFQQNILKGKVSWGGVGHHRIWISWYMILYWLILRGNRVLT